uniref:Uncharacterized protein n=1 Tax=Opuntia streptacantha TaxID=393608 RepID=A0A7C8YL62_OPUST
MRIHEQNLKKWRTGREGVKKKHISPFFLPISSLRDNKIGCLLYVIIHLSTSLQVKLHPETIFFEADCLRSSASIHIPLLIIASKGSNRMCISFQETHGLAARQQIVTREQAHVREAPTLTGLSLPPTLRACSNTSTKTPKR